MIVTEAQKWVGYMEHADGELLGVYQANTGPGNCTVFARMLLRRTGANFMGLPWCVTFVFSIFAEALGAKKMRRLLGRPTASATKLAGRMKRRGRWRGRGYTPRRNDMIFLSPQSDGRIGHVGIVAETKDGYVLSIDGNTVDPTGCFPEDYGGAVDYRARRLDDARIMGYAEMERG